MKWVKKYLTNPIPTKKNLTGSILEDLTNTKMICHKPAIIGHELALFVSSSIDGKIKPYVLNYIKFLRAQNIFVVLVIMTDIQNILLSEDILNNVDGLYVRENKGFDFAAWAHLLRIYPEFYNVNLLYLVNDSIIAPINERYFLELISKIRTSSSDFLGLTDSFEYNYHIQSFFMVLKKNVSNSEFFKNFINTVKEYSNVIEVVYNYELKLTEKLLEQGFSCEVMFPVYSKENSTTIHWQKLLQSQASFLKASVVYDRNPFEVDNRNWQTELLNQGYDISLITHEHSFQSRDGNELLKTWNKENNHEIAIYQIYYKSEQINALEKIFIPFDNSASFAPNLFEYAVFKKIFDASLHKKNELVGALSWKFKNKTNISGETFLAFIHNNPGYDVYFINPFPQELRFSSVWVQGEFCHSKILEITHKIFNVINYKIDLSKVKNDKFTSAYCNYWVGNQVFWEKYMDFTLPIYHYILYESPLYFRKLVLHTRADPIIDANYFAFIFERLFSLLLVHDPSIRSLGFPVYEDTAVS